MIEETLRKIGLAEYELKAYIALLRLGTCGAVELSRKSGVPFGKIYDILYSLELKGFVKVNLGKPKKFSPTDPKLALEAWLNRREDELLSLKSEVESAEKEMFSIMSKSKKPAVSMERGESNIKSMRIQEVLETEKEYCGIISPDVTTGPLPGLDKILKEKIKKGVIFRWIENPINEMVREKIKAKQQAGAKLKVGNQTGYNLTIVDNRKIRIELNDPSYGRTSLTIESPNLVKEWKNFFEFKWKQAK